MKDLIDKIKDKFTYCSTIDEACQLCAKIRMEAAEQLKYTVERLEEASVIQNDEE